MSARSLRSGIIKTGDSIQRATRQNTTLLKTENGFQQARQIDKRPCTLTFMLPTCSPPKKKRKESPPKKKPDTTEPKKNDNKPKPVGKPQQKKEESTTKETAASNSTKSYVPPKEFQVDFSMKRTPRMASLNAIVKVNAVLDSLCRAENKKKTLPLPVDKNKNKVNEKVKCESTRGKGKDAMKKDNANTKESRGGKSIGMQDCKSKGKDTSSVKLKRSNAVVVVKNEQKIKKETYMPIVDVVVKKENKTIGKAIDTTKKNKNIGNDVHKTKEATVNKDNEVVDGVRKEKTKFTRKDGTAIKKEPPKDNKEVERNKRVRKAENEVKCTTSKSISTVNEIATSQCLSNSYSKTTVSNQSRKKTGTSNSMKNIANSKIEVVIETCSDDTSEISDSESVPYDMSSPESLKECIEDSKKEMSDQAVQTDINDKSMQTDTKHLPNLNNKQLCTCKLESESAPAISPYSPVNPDYLTKPFYVKSSVLAHTNNHTLVVPIKKRHVLKEKENEYSKPTITSNISTLIDVCINNTLLQNNNTCSKLVYLSNYKEKSVVLNTPIDTKKDNPKPSKTVHLQVPKVNFDTVSEPKSTSVDKNNSKSMPVTSTKQKIKSPPGRRKKCNGWQFEGDPMEEPYTLGNQIITRRHYESVCRNKEILRIHDAVLLKSGMGKGDSDYVARISMFWEDLTGPHSADMMMSIYWYYKPQQTNFKFPETSKMEVYASRHRDDNSVACIVEKCYVISFTQFCRFQAQKMLLKEKRKKKLKVVPENKNLQSRFLPSPDVEESIVFFCRYGYEYRCGKLIKGL